MAPQTTLSRIQETPEAETGFSDWLPGLQRQETHSGNKKDHAFSLHLNEIRAMVSWYRSRDMRKVAEAADWLIQIDVKGTIEGLLQQLDHDDPFVVEDAKDLLAAFGEIAFKRVVGLLGKPAHWRNGLDILSEMDGHVVPHMIRVSKTTDSFDTRVGLLRALTSHTHHSEAAKAVREGLGDPDPIVGTFVCQALLERGPVGHQFLERVFPQEQVLVA